jgi:DNA-binding CsgD family transcriptional regulator
MTLSSQANRAASEIRDALSSSLDLRQAIGAASPLLLRLLNADYAALGVTAPEVPGGFDWIVARMPERYFEAYGELAPHDFVLHSVLRAPNRVLRDSEMLSRRDLEGSALYRRARDLGMPMEHVMSTMLHVDDEWQSGLSLYRVEQDPFSDAERAILQSIAPALQHTVRNCRLLAHLERRASCLEHVVSRNGLAAIVFAHPAREVARSESACRLLAEWFAPTECGVGGVPLRILDEVRRWLTDTATDVAPVTLRRESADAVLAIRPYWLEEAGRRYVILTLRQVPKDPAVPDAWRTRLTPREVEVVQSILRGWDNLLVAQELGCSEATVKQHLTRAYGKLGVEQRSQLVARARVECL